MQKPAAKKLVRRTPGSNSSDYSDSEPDSDYKKCSSEEERRKRKRAGRGRGRGAAPAAAKKRKLSLHEQIRMESAAVRDAFPAQIRLEEVGVFLLS